MYRFTGILVNQSDTVKIHGQEFLSNLFYFLLEYNIQLIQSNFHTKLPRLHQLNYIIH